MRSNAVIDADCQWTVRSTVNCMLNSINFEKIRFFFSFFLFVHQTMQISISITLFLFFIETGEGAGGKNNICINVCGYVYKKFDKYVYILIILVSFRNGII